MWSRQIRAGWHGRSQSWLRVAIRIYHAISNDSIRDGDIVLLPLAFDYARYVFGANEAPASTSRSTTTCWGQHGPKAFTTTGFWTAKALPGKSKSPCRRFSFTRRLGHRDGVGGVEISIGSEARRPPCQRGPTSKGPSRRDLRPGKAASKRTRGRQDKLSSRSEEREQRLSIKRTTPTAGTGLWRCARAALKRAACPNSLPCRPLRAPGACRR